MKMPEYITDNFMSKDWNSIDKLNKEPEVNKQIE
jgi:hypothetical protein